MGSLSQVVGTTKNGEVKIVADSYDNGVVRVDCLSETFYTICFKPETCKFETGTDAYNALLSACAQAELALSKKWHFMLNNLDVGILAVSRDKNVETGDDFNISDALIGIANLITSYRHY